MPFGILLESGIYVVFLFWLSRQRPLMDQLRALAVPYRVLLVALPVAVLVGQLVNRSERTFPWVAWAMYTESRTGDVRYLEYSAELANREEVALPIARSFSRLGKKLVWRLRGLETAGNTAAHDRLLRAMVRRYNTEHHDNPVRTVRVWRCVVPMNDAPGRDSIRRELSREVAVD